MKMMKQAIPINIIKGCGRRCRIDFFTFDDASRRVFSTAFMLYGTERKTIITNSKLTANALITDEILKASNAVIVSTPANPPRLAIP